jgi:hypothetical protein
MAAACSPGNDLESIAGQVATGCNLIYFITGNGSITNFPFVPTIKIVTTTARFELLKVRTGGGGREEKAQRALPRAAGAARISVRNTRPRAPRHISLLAYRLPRTRLPRRTTWTSTRAGTRRVRPCRRWGGSCLT